MQRDDSLERTLILGKIQGKRRSQRQKIKWLDSISSSMDMNLSKLWEIWGFPGGSDVKRICLQCRKPGFDPWVRKISWRREWLPIPVFLSGEFHGQRSLVSYSPWGPQRVRHHLATEPQQQSYRYIDHLLNGWLNAGITTGKQGIWVLNKKV